MSKSRIKYIIYKAVNTCNGKVYIGQTKQELTSRIKQHFSHIKSEKYYFHSALNKYGKANFKNVNMDTLLRLRKQGKSLRAIANALNVSAQTIANRLK